jgi:hypothetical protein
MRRRLFGLTPERILVLRRICCGNRRILIDANSVKDRAKRCVFAREALRLR